MMVRVHPSHPHHNKGDKMIIVCSKCNTPISNVVVSEVEDGYDIKVECHGEKDEMLLSKQFLIDNEDIQLAEKINIGMIPGYAFQSE